MICIEQENRKIEIENTGRKLTDRFPILSKIERYPVQVLEFKASLGRKKVVTIVMLTMVFFRWRPNLHF